MPTLRRVFQGLLIALTVSACQQYDITVNDKLVYQPKRLLTDIQLKDSGLQNCVTQAITDQQISSPAELSDLNCSNAGIAVLDGLSLFSGIRRLKLSDNSLRNLLELEQLKMLEALWLDNNGIVDPVPLSHLVHLETLDLRHNPRLQCPDSALFDHVTNLQLPEHCGRS